MKSRRPLITLLLASLSICGASVFVSTNKTKVAFATVGEYETSASTFYSGITATSGKALLGQVHDVMATNHKHYTTYADCFDNTYVSATDPGTKSGYITDFYGQRDYEVTKHVSGSTGWNREHVWAKSQSSGTFVESGAGGDIHHIRPEDNHINSCRGNLPFGNVRTKTSSYTTATSSLYSFTGGYYTTSAFEPLDSVKGDVARILMYVYAHYSSPSNVGGTATSSYFGNLQIRNIVDGSTDSECWKILLDWNKNDPVSQAERIRNEEAASLTGTRNAFIDHPEYADAIWGSTPIEQGGSSSSSSESSTGSSSSSSEETSSSSSENPVTPTSNIDVITAEKTGVSTTSYSQWSYTNNATYVGKTATNKGNIQLNSNTGIGIVSTASTKELDTLTINISEGTNSIKVFASNTPYTSVADLTSSSTYGTLVETVSSTETIDLSGYKYFGLLPVKGVVYISSIEASYKEEGAPVETNPAEFLKKVETKSSLKYKWTKSEDTTTTTNYSYKKVTSALSDYSGKYLIVCEDTKQAFNSSASSLNSTDNHSTITITSSTINYNETTSAYAVDIAKHDSGYSIKASNGTYIGMSSDTNGLNTSSTPLVNGISVSNGVADIVGTGKAVLRYNISASMFRYYKSSSYTAQSAIALYKLTGENEEASTTTYTYSDVALRFGAVLPYSDWATLTSKTNVTGYGVVAGVASSLTTTIESLYKNSKENVSSTKWI
ncbi:MAG: endonuclease, partial [Bacilli bacterium]|nr:endonuclease [Bacilli bacterium]